MRKKSKQTPHGPHCNENYEIPIICFLRCLKMIHGSDENTACTGSVGTAKGLSEEMCSSRWPG